MPVELNASSAFSFLRASSLPEELVERAAELGYSALALVDRDGVSGAPRFFKAARKAGLRPLVGAALTLPGGGALPLLVESRQGYQNLCRLITLMKAGAPKGEGALSLDLLEGRTQGLVALVGEATLFPEVPRARQLEPELARLERLESLFRRPGGGCDVVIDVERHRRREQEARNQALVELADARGLQAVASNGVRHARSRGRALFDVLTCIREKTTLAAAGRLLAHNAERHLKTPRAMAALFRDRPDLVRNAEALAERLCFTLADLGYRFPDYPLPPGETQQSFLEAITDAGARQRYRPYHEKARRQIERELRLIGKLELAGYFLIVWDIVSFCRREGILAQGRGSAANSAVCYSLGITAVDPVGMELLFERFLSEERGEWPDIDVDLPSGDRRERVIQYVYERYGARGAAMTANVISYRDRSASREIGKALGIPPAEIDRLARQMRRFEWSDPADTLARRLERAGLDGGDPRIALFARLFQEIQDLPRHLGQHSGGMVIAQGALDAVVPLEPAAMPGRVVVQWDKEDCADLGIIKVDLLGLGMMSALQDTLALVREHEGVEIDLAHLPQDDPKVYAMLRRADTVGVFQVESRAQMATLPRMRPERFYDLVVEVAIIRPGPIVGKMVHPYLDRRAGREPVTYPHPSLEPILKRTLGVPLFQEQLLRMAMTVAGFTGGEAEELRRAMGFKRSEQRMREIEVRLRAGMERNGIAGETADAIVRSIVSFALYGFPESHAASFALIAYASAWLRAYHCAAFSCALLNNQPMGFYHPMTLVKDAQRHGVRLRPADVTASGWDCTLESGEAGAGPVLRVGLRYVRGLRREAGEGIARERRLRPFASLQDLVDRCALRRDERLMLAEVGAFNAFGLTRRSALWQVEKAGRPAGPLLRQAHGANEAAGASPLPEMELPERMASDLLGTGLSIGPHPMALYRPQLRAQGVLRAADLERVEDGRRVRVAGAVICRQRPGTAKGFLFLTLEDETGLVNVTVRPDLFEKRHETLLRQDVLEIEGYLQASEGLSVRAIEVRAAGTAPGGVSYARNFR
ncbi:MAG: error-prone DNA polymerase [Vicinamibacteria bacterium]